ncbi:MAG: PAS domain S-box protein [Opitutales bacterium]|nr:PAS domain S-box protein [Opitutales bacterium]
MAQPLPPDKAHKLTFPPIRVALIYALFGTLWIFFSDQFIQGLSSDPDVLTRLQTGKGWAYVALTALLAYVLCHALNRRILNQSKALREAEALHRLTLRSIGDGVIATDREGRITWMNPVAESMTGYQDLDSRGKLLGDVFRIISSENGKPVDNPVSKVLRSGVTVGLANHTLLIPREGPKLSIADSAAPIMDEEGMVHGVILVFRDVSEQEASRRAVELSERRLNQAIEASQDGIWDYDLERGSLYFNNRVLHILGLRLSDNTIGEAAFWERIHPVDRDGLRRELDALRKGERDRMEAVYRMRREDGSWCWIRSKGMVVNRDPQGLPMRITGTYSDITSFREAELAMAKTKFALDQSQISIFQIDPDGTITYVNDHAARNLGYSRDEMMEMNLSDIDPLFDLGKMAEYGKTLRARGHVVFESVHQRKGGEEFPVEITLIHGRFEGEEVSFAFSVDISERRRREQNLREMDERFRKLLSDLSSISIRGFYPDGTVFYWNKASENMFGYTPEEMIGQDYIEKLIPEEVRSEVRESIEEAASSGAIPPPFELKLMRKDTSERWVYTHPAMIRVGDRLECYCLDIDLSPVKQAEEQLRRMNTILNSVREVNQLITQETDVSALVRQACTILVRDRGYRRAWISTRDADGRLSYFWEMPDVDESFREWIADGNQTQCMIDAVAKADVSVRAVRSDCCEHCPHSGLCEDYACLNMPLVFGGKTYGFLSVSTCPYHKMSDEEVGLFREVGNDLAFAFYRLELEQQKAKALRDLIIAKELADCANKAKDEFLSIMSHEMRTPLNPILGFTSLMMDMVVDPEQKDYLKSIRDSGERMLALIDNILQYAKLNHGSMSPTLGRFKVVEDCRTVMQSCRPNSPKVSMVLETKLDGWEDVPDDLEVLSDRHMVQRVLENLLKNACKFTNSGTVRLSLGYRRSTASPQHCLRFEVRDTGIGIPDSHQTKIFQPFSQADTSHSREYEGAGLGLAISRKLVNLLGGEIGFESRENEGSLFWFTLPWGNLEQKSARVASAHKPLSHLDEPIHILIVDDTADNARIIEVIVKHAGGRSLTASSGYEAIAMAEETRFDLILMDLSMPDVDGFEVTERILNGENPNRHTPIVALSAHVSPEIRNRCLACGMKGHIAKPVNPSELVDAIRLHAEGS